MSVRVINGDPEKLHARLAVGLMIEQVAEPTGLQLGFRGEEAGWWCYHFTAVIMG